MNYNEELIILLSELLNYDMALKIQQYKIYYESSKLCTVCNKYKYLKDFDNEYICSKSCDYCGICIVINTNKCNTCLNIEI